MLLAEQPYVKIHRMIKDFRQVEMEEPRTIFLYQSEIVTKYHRFDLNDVWDVTYRKIGPEGGLLYLHTSGGVYAYTVKESAEAFIKVYRDYRESMR